MGERRWLQALVLSFTIVVSMVLGGVLAVNFSDDGSGVGVAPAATEEPSGSDVPVSTVSADPTPETEGGAAIATIPDLPGLVDEVTQSVVLIQTQAALTRGQGSGVVIDRSGHILTNMHVIQGAETISVQLHDGSVAPAQVVGTDPGSDLAVIRADFTADQLVPATFGDSDAVRVGEPVFAIGSPFSLTFSVTSGIVSGINRESQPSPIGRTIRGVLQTDAAVNPGNSGGPLFNAKGEVIGINTSVENPLGQNFFVGIGYAVPSNTALRFIPNMIAGEEVQHPQLGITGVSLNAVSAQDAGVGVTSGVYVTSVAPGSAADRAGVTAADITDGGGGELPGGGDVIVAIDGEDVTSFDDLARIVDSRNVGDQVVLQVVRDGQAIELTATLQEWPA